MSSRFGLLDQVREESSSEERVRIILLIYTKVGLGAV